MGALTSPVERFKGTVVLHDPLPLPAVLAFEEAQQRSGPQFCPEAVQLIYKRNDAIENKDEKAQKKVQSEIEAHLAACLDSEKKPRCKPPLMGAASDNVAIPAILACVKEWHLENVPEKPTAATFPGSPRAESRALIAWLMDEIRTLYNGEGLDAQDPNA